MLNEAAANVKLLCLDVDGVLTDGSIYLDNMGNEIKRFHVRDGCGIKIWQQLGYQTAIITGRTGMAVQHRAKELGIIHVYQGSVDKAVTLGQLLQELELHPEQVAVLADDLPDVPMLQLAGYPMAVSDACGEVQDLAEFVTVRPGGHGAVREAIEHLLKSQNIWDDALSLFGLNENE